MRAATPLPFETISIVNRIGGGSYGVVSLAIGELPDGTKEPIAVKQILLTQGAAPPEVLRDFQQEATILARLAHPNIVQYHGTWSSEGAARPRDTIVMAYHPLGSLESLLKACRLRHPLRWSQRTRIALDIARGLEYLHSQDMMHLDLKSANVLMAVEENDLQAKLTDFGLTKIREETIRTMTGGKGTPAWMAPEIMQGVPAYSPAADVYAYGMTLWELASQSEPYATMNMWGIMGHVLGGQRETIPEAIPAGLRELIESCWQQDRGARPIMVSVRETLEAQSAAWSAYEPIAEAAAAPEVDVATLTAERDAAQARVRELETQTAALTTARDTAITERDAVQRQLTTVETRLQQMTQEHGRLAEANPALQLENQRLQRQLENQVVVEQRVQSRIETLERELAERTEQLARTEALLQEALEQHSPTLPPRAPESAPAYPTPVASGGAGLFGRLDPARRAIPVAVDPAELYVFLKHVVMGEQNEAEALLQRMPALSCAYGDIDDLPNGMRDLDDKRLTRHFEHITGFQYALWAGDWHMWRMVQTYLPPAAQREQLEEILTDRAPWIAAHGRYFDLGLLIAALRTYVNQYKNWNGEQRRTYWCKTIGGLQRQLPVHVINEYCRPDRSFDPVPDFRDATALPRRDYVDRNGKEYGVNWWFNQVYSSGKLGSTWAGRRGRRGGAAAADGFGCLLKMSGHLDVQSLDSLSTTRRQQVEELVESLGLTPPAHPGIGAV